MIDPKLMEKPFEFKGFTYTYKTLKDYEVVKVFDNRARTKRGAVRNKLTGQLFYYQYNQSYNNVVDESFYLMPSDIDIDKMEATVTYKEPLIMIGQGFKVYVKE
ncbi:MAG TPA: hypothetical protein VK190_02515 [Pseudoneobacillus sp.]|nr:hypothetical protein [Pseudoneobacillus sp.]